MTVPLHGLIHVYGPDGVGKTSLALTTGADLAKSVFIDDDSSKSKDKTTKWKEYVDLMAATKGKNEIQLFDFVSKKIESYADNSLDLIVFDNMKRVFDAAHSYLLTNKQSYRQIMRGSGEIIGGLEWREVREHVLPKLYSAMLSKAKLVIVITHEKEQSKDGVKTGQMEAAADKSLRKAASPIIRLTLDKDGSPVPVGLVIKNIGIISADGEIVRVLPPKIKNCTWKTIRNYLEKPVGNGDLPEDMMPDEFEQALITGSLTKEQQRQYEFNKRMALLRVNEELTNAVQSLINEGVTAPPMILKQLKEQGIEADMNAVNNIIKAMNEV
jgi:hypothetical protein